MNALELYERYKGYLQYDPDNTELVSKTIEYALKAGDMDNAWALSVLAINEFSQDESCYYQAVTASLATHHYSEAVAWLVETVQSESPPVWALFNYAFALLHLGEYAKVIEHFVQNESNESVAREAPSLLVLKARALYCLGSYTECEKDLNLYIGSFPDDPEAFGLLSLVLYDRGDLDKAEKMAMRAIGIDENQIEAILALASISLARRNIQSANKYVDSILSKAPNVGRALAIKGQLRLIENNHLEAKACFEHALQSLSSHIGTWHGLAWCHLLSEEYDKCAYAFEEALKLDHNFAETHGGLALLYALTGEVVKANEYLEKALRLDRRCFSGMFAKAILLRHQGQDREANRLINTILGSSVMEGDLPLRDIVSKLAAKSDSSLNE